VRAALAIVCAALALGQSACTFGPAASDGGTGGGGSTESARTVGDQCESVLVSFCQAAATCGTLSDMSDCVNGNMDLCCVGTACNATSTVSESDVTACEQSFAAEGCYALSLTMNPTSCLSSS
jgi:hypothetical protein